LNNSIKYGKLFLLPNTLGSDALHDVIPPGVHEKIILLKHFIVENEKSARHFLKAAGIITPQSELQIVTIDKHEKITDMRVAMNFLFDGNDTGLLSEAGSPAVADPGSAYVKFAHENKIKVVPLTGPSSIILALAASGLNGQQFCFHGYLPVLKNEKVAKIKQLEKESKQKNQTQIFIETPYRNNALLSDLLQNCNDYTLLCVATDITLPSEEIRTMSISMWKKIKTDLHKRPTVYLLLLS
jgi:16S rRNA (cytidine1402-2'-O)-methyltransferase